jgi:hypothetical protein
MKRFNPAARVRAHAALVSCRRAELSDAAIILILFALVFGPIIGLHLALSAQGSAAQGLAAQGPAAQGPAAQGPAAQGPPAHGDPRSVAQGTSYHGPRG